MDTKTSVNEGKHKIAVLLISESHERRSDYGQISEIIALVHVRYASFMRRHFEALHAQRFWAGAF